MQLRLLLLLLAFSLPAAADDDHRRHEVRLMDGGTLTFEMPAAWGSRPEIKRGEEVVEMYFVPFGTPREPVFAITVAATVPLETPTVDTVRQVAEAIRENFKETALEDEIEIHDISGDGNIIQYFTLTDKEIKPREYQYLTTGIVSDGTMLTTCYFFSNDSAPDYAADAMTLMESLAYTPKKEK